MTQAIVPCLWCDGTAEDQARFYTSLFPRSTIRTVSRFGKAGEDVHGQPEGRVMVAEFEIAGRRVSALNGGPTFRPNPSISLFVSCADVAEVDRLWAGLAEGGAVLMPLDRYDWSPRYGWVQDRWGVSWQIGVGEGVKEVAIHPALMFTGAQAGRAEAAMALYASLFGGDGAIVHARYDGSGPDRAGTVMYATFALRAQAFSAMDSAAAHAFAFDEGVSLMAFCETQAEIDRLWSALTAEGGAESMCGWLKDRFGVSWQIVPTAMGRLMTEGGPGAGDRVMNALLGMRKIDLPALEAAFRG